MKLQKFENEILDIKVGCFINDKNEIYFRGKDVATALNCIDTTSAISDHVDYEYKNKLEELWAGVSPGLTSNEKKSVYINESGLYSLILRSNKEEAK